jgi:hypothetical protein
VLWMNEFMAMAFHPIKSVLYCLNSLRPRPIGLASGEAWYVGEGVITGWGGGWQRRGDTLRETRWVCEILCATGTICACTYVVVFP